MGIRHGRSVRLLFVGVWVCVLVLVLRTGMGAIGTGAEHMIGLLAAGYLAAWGPYFLLSRRGPAGRAVRFAACTASILAGLAAFEVPAMIGLVDYRAVFSTPDPGLAEAGQSARPGPRSTSARGTGGPACGSGGADLHRLRGCQAAPVYQCDLRLDRNGFRNPADLGGGRDRRWATRSSRGCRSPRPNWSRPGWRGGSGRAVVNLGPDRLRAAAGAGTSLRRYGLALHPRAVRLGLLRGERPPGRRDLRRRSRKRASRGPSQPAPRAWYARGLDAQRPRVRRSATGSARAEAARRGRQAGRLVDRSGRAVDIYFSCGDPRGRGPPRRRPARIARAGRPVGSSAEAHAACERRASTSSWRSSRRSSGSIATSAPSTAGSPCRIWAVDDLPGAASRPSPRSRRRSASST